MYSCIDSRLDLDVRMLVNCAIPISRLKRRGWVWVREYEKLQMRMFWPGQWFWQHSDRRKYTPNLITVSLQLRHASTCLRKYSSRPWTFQQPISRETVSLYEFIDSFRYTSHTFSPLELCNHWERLSARIGSLYLTAFQNGDIPPERFLLVNELPPVVRCHWSTDKSNNWTIVIEAELFSNV